MSIPILLVVPPSAPLAHASATVLSLHLKSTAKDIAPPLAFHLPGFTLNTAFAAVPLARKHNVLSDGFAMASTDKGLGSAGYVVQGSVPDQQALAALDAVTKEQFGRQAVFADPVIAGFPVCGGTPPVGNTAAVQQQLDSGRINSLGMVGANTAIAIFDTGINQAHLTTRGVNPAAVNSALFWTATVGGSAGNSAVGHGTMCAYDALIAAPAAQLLDFPILQSLPASPVVIGGVLSNALQAYNYVNLNFYALAPGLRPFQRLVLNNSWGVFDPAWDFPAGHPGRYIDNPAHPFNQLVGTLAAAGADILFAAGNCGPICPDGRCHHSTFIMGANSHPEVICVGGVDVNGVLAGYSSHGPGMLTPAKPDLVAYTHFDGSQAFGVGSADSGTSAACPVMAGVIAALRSAATAPTGNPRQQLVQALLSNATRNGPAGHQLDDGWGTVDLNFITNLQSALNIV